MTTSRKIYLGALVTEAVRVLKEANFPPPAQSAVPPSPAPVSPDTNASAQTPPPAIPPADPNVAATTPGAEPPKPFDVDTMIDRLNVIRGGKSFSDPEVYGQLVSYFNTLSEADKGIIDRFLQNIGKTVIRVDGNQPGTGGGVQPPTNQGAPPVAPAPAPGV